jgi:hypothetical protein
MDPAPMSPSAPAFAAATASFQPLTQTMPAWMMG